MLKPKRFIIAALLLAGAVSLLLFFRSARVGRMLDGSPVVLEAVTFGRKHHSPVSKMDSLFAKLPGWVTRALQWRPGRAEEFSSDNDTFAFWLRFGNGKEDKSIRYAFADVNGYESPTLFMGNRAYKIDVQFGDGINGRYMDYQPPGFGTNMIGHVRCFGLLPRRSEKFFLRLYEQDESGRLKRVASFPIRNLAVSMAPGWIAEPFPISRSTNGITFSLVKAVIGTRPKESPPPLRPGHWSEFRFQVVDPTNGPAGWSVSEMWLSDATENFYRTAPDCPGMFVTGLEKDELVCFSRWGFWPGESAWKLKAHFENGVGGDGWIECFFKPTLSR
jgi:hypothetical protein